ncbi:hypothetical protein [Acinetobacter sp. A47]|uniref:hypothetical protein n=1 Tax=Acinetobacter sp. A47 TaxID=1561217 RepID=UPI00056F2DB2|nr:hypothetical protein [Acinetobacter sp. A47]
MRLKYLTLCLMGLSLGACSQHVIKTNPVSTSLEQKAVNSLNAMYEYPSYDYRGKFKVHIDQNPTKKETTSQPVELDAALKHKVDQYLSDQKVTLSRPQKQALYTALAQEQKTHARSSADKFMQVMGNILNDMQFEYDGSVHYRQKMGSFNLTARYEKPTLLVQAKVPMVLDLNHYKFYINNFALMPYLVNKENQNKLAYLDFSKYQDRFKQVDYKKFAEYVKASGAVYYRLADQNNIQALSVSSADQAAGVVEKIRLKTSVEELILQANLYSKVNEKYFMQSVLNLNAQNLEKLVADEVANAGQAKSKASLLDAKDSADDASLVSQQLYRLVNQHFGVEDVEADDADERADTAEAAVADEPKASEYPELSDELDTSEEQQAGLSEQQCTALQTALKTSYGDVQYCQTVYSIDVFSGQPGEAGFLTYIQKLQAVEKEFAVYDQNQFIDDQAFKTFWLKHRADIEKALPPVDKRNPFVMDIGLDAKGRVAKIDYDLNYALPELKSRFKVKADMLISNYGQGTPIDQAQLKQAKSWTEASKGSMLEQAVNSFSEKLGQTGIQERSAAPYRLSLDDQLNMIAEQRYDATGAYEPTYKAVFIAKLTETAPQIVQRYSSQELQEIASVYAYWYADEEIYHPEGKALQKIEALQKKHHLQNEVQFDDDLGQAVNRIVAEAMQGKQARQEWRKLQAQYKQPQQLFAKQYQLQFEQENGASTEDKVLLAQTANILGQVYVDARKNRLSEQSIKALKIEHNEFIDYEIFKEVYQKMLTVR